MDSLKRHARPFKTAGKAILTCAMALLVVGCTPTPFTQGLARNEALDSHLAQQPYRDVLIKRKVSSIHVECERYGRSSVTYLVTTYVGQFGSREIKREQNCSSYKLMAIEWVRGGYFVWSAENYAPQVLDAVVGDVIQSSEPRVSIN